MSKKVLIIISIIVIILVLGIGAKYYLEKSKPEMFYCIDETHRYAYPVNPYCTKCGRIDGVAQHECSNPNGVVDIYCRTCGKRNPERWMKD